MALYQKVRIVRGPWAGKVGTIMDDLYLEAYFVEILKNGPRLVPVNEKDLELYEN